LEVEAQRVRGPRPRVRFRIVDADDELHAAEIDPSEALGQLQRFSVRMAAVIEPAALLETSGLDDKGVALPTGNRVAVPGGIRIHWHLPTVCGEVPGAGECLAHH